MWPYHPTVRTPRLLSAGGGGGEGEGGWTSYQIFKKGGLDTTLIFKGGLVRKRAVTFSRGVCNFYVKNKLKSDIFNDKKSW